MGKPITSKSWEVIWVLLLDFMTGGGFCLLLHTHQLLGVKPRLTQLLSGVQHPPGCTSKSSGAWAE